MNNANSVELLKSNRDILHHRNSFEFSYGNDLVAQ